MRTDACRQWDGALAARALGIPDPESDLGLDAHLEGCASCRAELDDLSAVADAASLADPGRLDDTPLAPMLADRIIDQVALEADLARRRRRRRILLSVAAVVAAIAMLAASVLTVIRVDPGDDGPAPIKLAGPPGVEGTASLTARAWGTEIALDVTGLEPGEVYWLWLSDADGQRTVAGTFTGTGGAAQLELASAMPIREAARIWMTDTEDEVVLDAFIE